MLALITLSLGVTANGEYGSEDSYLAKILRAIMDLDDAEAVDPDFSVDPIIDLASNLVTAKTTTRPPTTKSSGPGKHTKPAPPPTGKGDMIKPAPEEPPMNKNMADIVPKGIKPAPPIVAVDPMPPPGAMTRPAPPVVAVDPMPPPGAMTRPAPPIVAVDPMPPPGHMTKPAPEDDCQCPMGRRRLVNPTGYACPAGGKKVPKMQELPCAGGTKTMQCEGPYFECELLGGERVPACNLETGNCAALMGSTADSTEAETLLEQIEEKLARGLAAPRTPNPRPSGCTDAWDCHGTSVYCWKGYYGADNFCQYGEGIGSLCKDDSGCGWLGQGSSARQMNCVHEMHYNRRRSTSAFAPAPRPPAGEYYGTCKDPWAYYL